MAITLYQFERSQFCEKVRIVLDLKGLKYQKVNVPHNDRAELINLSGQKKVPVIKDGDKVIIDSTYIVAHLEATYPENSVYPHQPSDKALALLIEDWADEALNAPIRALYREKDDQALRDAAIKLLNEKLDYLDRLFGSKTFLFGKISIAEISIYCQLRSFETLLKMDMDPRFKSLKAWCQTIKEHLLVKASAHQSPSIPEPTG